VEAAVKVRTLAAVAALALGTAISGGAAHAASYMLTVDGCSAPGCLGGNTQVGTVNVTQNGGALDFSVVLDNGVLFNNEHNPNSQHHAFVFDLAPGLASLSGLSYGNFTTVNASNQVVSTTAFTGDSPPPFSDSPFGSAWTNAIDYNSGVTGNHSTNASNFSFELSDTAGDLLLSMLHFGDVYNGNQIMVAADVYNPNIYNPATQTYGNTGNVGGLAGGVPEPATWGLMITGVFCIGAAMRQQRRQALTVA
jgi:hypothetical protein